MAIESDDVIIFGTLIPAGPSTGGGLDTSAIVMDENIWDRYQNLNDFFSD